VSCFERQCTYIWQAQALRQAKVVNININNLSTCRNIKDTRVLDYKSPECSILSTCRRNGRLVAYRRLVERRQATYRKWTVRLVEFYKSPSTRRQCVIGLNVAFGRYWTLTSSLYCTVYAIFPLSVKTLLLCTSSETSVAHTVSRPNVCTPSHGWLCGRRTSAVLHSTGS